MTTRYLTTDEFLARFKESQVRQILGATKENPEVDTALLTGFIEQAEAFADSFIQVQYQLPLKSVPPVLKIAVGDIARYYAHSDKSTAVVDKFYQDAVSFLRQVAGRRNMLGVPDEATAVAAPVKKTLVRRARRPGCVEGF